MAHVLMSSVIDSLCNDIVDFVDRGGMPVWHLYAPVHGEQRLEIREEYESSDMDTSFLDSGDNLLRECFARCANEGMV